MSIHAQYMVKCAGGGWLDPGRPLKCHRVFREFGSAVEAHTTAVRAGWKYDVVTEEHRCPQHPAGDHVHAFTDIASYPDGPKSTASVQACACGALREV